jgi:hypothetical protein
MKYRKYSLWSYDVWGNAEDGYDVNDRSCYDRSFVVACPRHVFNEGTPQEFDTYPVPDSVIEEVFGEDPDIDGEDDFTLYAADADGRHVGEMQFEGFCDSDGNPLD